MCRVVQSYSTTTLREFGLDPLNNDLYGLDFNKLFEFIIIIVIIKP